MTLNGFCAEPLAKGKQKKSTVERDAKLPKTTIRAGKRVALVIGNSKYATGPLKTSVNDAHALAATLRRIGFEVEEKVNLGQHSLKKELKAFGKRAKGSEVALFYFAGHGLQIRGKNYLVPVDVKISTENEALGKTVAVDQVLEMMQSAKNGVKIVVLDASRGLPLEGRAVGRGLAAMEAPPGTIIASAASPGMISANSDGNIGMYADALVLALDTPGLEIDELFTRASTQVANRTDNAQEPWLSSSLNGGVNLVPPFDPRVSRGKDSIPKALELPLRQFTEPITGMVFLPVPGGCFQMGDTFGDGFGWEKPVHLTCVRDYSLGKYEVTQGQWRRIMGSNPARFSNCGDDCPVENVSWDDAQEFVRQLNKMSGGKYRLPTEAEWEYAARSGGKNDRFSGGYDVNAVAWHDMNSSGETHRVGSKQPNGLGFYDMSGNVWEWVHDWFGPYDRIRQESPSGPLSGTFRVFRGGGWSHSAGQARVVTRFYNTPDKRLDFVGLRLAAPVASAAK
jgi:formylglycine-generating enzyme required for sulfatase activity